jgi:hypothetical protein
MIITEAESPASVDGYSVDFGGHSHHLPDDQNIKEESH